MGDRVKRVEAESNVGKRLVVVSPYWDEELKALKSILKKISPTNVQLLIDSGAGLFPTSAMKKVKSVRLFDRDEFRKGRFLHAKAIIAQTRKADHVLYGSANCTVAALGTVGFAGANEEVCVYQRFPAGTVLETLQLSKLLDPGREIDPADLEEGEHEDELDLEGWRKRTPGRFECRYDTLIWTPEPDLDPDSVTIELRNSSGQSLDCHLAPGTEHDNSRHYQILRHTERPGFAVLQFSDGTKSAPAIVTLIDSIREAAREARSKQTENAASQLAEETEEGLWLLEVLDTLESAEQRQDGGDEKASVKRGRKNGRKAEETQKKFRTLSYEEFIAGRRPRAKDSVVSRNSLGGSEMSLVRGFLNRILEIGNADAQTDMDEEKNLENAFDLGDETANAEEAMDRGETFDADEGEKSPEEKMREEWRRKAVQTKATRSQMADAVTAFNKRISERKSNGTLTTFDVLRLRALLMIVTAAGWGGWEDGTSGSEARTSFQVLPVEDGTEGWPRLMGRLLFAFFGGNVPAIRHVNLDAVHDQLTNDVLECWATCFWCLQACFGAPCSKNEQAALTRFIPTLGDRVYRLTGLTPSELLADDIELVMERMSERFAQRLGLDPVTLRKRHEALVRDTFEEK
jgi:hypothetical protein